LEAAQDYRGSAGVAETLEKSRRRERIGRPIKLSQGKPVEFLMV
jgi:hypothetical protein